MESAFPVPISRLGTRQLLLVFHSKKCSLLRLQPTVTASPEDYIWRRSLPGTGAKGIQAVKGIISAVSRGREGVAALGVPAVDVATVSDTTLRALDVISLLFKKKTKGLQSLLQQTQSLRISGKSVPGSLQKLLHTESPERLQHAVITLTIICKSTFHSSTLPCYSFLNQKITHIKKK